MKRLMRISSFYSLGQFLFYLLAIRITALSTCTIFTKAFVPSSSKSTHSIHITRQRRSLHLQQHGYQSRQNSNDVLFRRQFLKDIPPLLLHQPLRCFPFALYSSRRHVDPTDDDDDDDEYYKEKSNKKQRNNAKDYYSDQDGGEDDAYYNDKDSNNDYEYKGPQRVNGSRQPAAATQYREPATRNYYDKIQNDLPRRRDQPPQTPSQSSFSTKYNNRDFEYYDDNNDGEYYDDDVGYVDNSNNLDNSKDGDTALGNYWSNPRPGWDSNVDSNNQRRPRPRYSNMDGTNAIVKRQSLQQNEALPPTRNNNSRKRTTFRSGTPPPPPPVADFYNRLFWYGLDESASNDPRGSPSNPVDRTMFGGTKGKFNGLWYLGDEKESLQDKNKDQQPSKTTDEYNDYDYDDNYDDYDRDYYERREGRRRPVNNGYRIDDDDIDADQTDKYPTSASVPKFYTDKPPYDQPRPMPSPPTQVPSSMHPRRRKRRRPQQQQSAIPGFGDDVNGYYTRQDDQNQDRVGDKVSRWFTDNNNNESYDNVDDDRNYDIGGNPPRNNRRQRNNNNKALWMNAIDVFLGVNRDELSQQAESYNRAMGIPSSRNNNDDNDYYVDDYDDNVENKRPSYNNNVRQRPRSRQSSARSERNGFAYPDTESIDVDRQRGNKRVDAESFYIDSPDPALTNPDVIDTFATAEEKTEIDAINERESDNRRKEMTWSERALAVERVPPVGVPAWGPSGPLDMDARTKAINDALEDLSLARQRVADKQRQVEYAKEDVSIARVDVELERKRLSKVRPDQVRYIQDTIRQLEQQIEKASRALRLAQIHLDKANEDLVELEQRHWAVLSCYDPQQAQQSIASAMLELEEQEPALKRIRERNIAQQRETASTQAADLDAQAPS